MVTYRVKGNQLIDMEHYVEAATCLSSSVTLFGRNSMEKLGVSEKHSLLKTKKTDTNYGALPRKESKGREKKEEGKTTRIPFFKLFRFATGKDYALMTLGSVFAIIHGSGWPLLAIVFGQMTNTFLELTPGAVVLPTDGGVASSNLTSNETSFGPLPIVADSPFEAIMTTYAIYYALIGTVVLVAATLQVACWQYACERQTHQLRQEFFYHVMRQEIGWFDRHDSGEFTSKLHDDMERVREGLGDKLSLLIQFVAAFFAGFAVGFIKGWQLTVVIICLTPLLAISTAFVGKVSATSALREQRKYALASTVAEEVLANIRTVVTLCGQWMEIKRFSGFLEEANVLGKRKYIKQGIGFGFNYLVLYCSYGVAYWFGTRLVLAGEMDPGSVFAVLVAVMIGSFSVGNAMGPLTSVATALGSAALIYEIIDKSPKIDPYSNAGMRSETVRSNIEFNEVGFTYPTRKSVQVLKNFTLSIKEGQTVALCGSSGCGKSTIVNLLLRFYDPSQGTISIDGVNLKHWNVHWLRSMIGVVRQEPVLFGYSIEENIRLGNYDATPYEILSAAEKANAHEFIRELPDGYKTMVGERGAQLSGGQKQRIAIARALVRNPKILLLDEATSALDAESESVVQVALDKASEGRTTIIIAHRLSTIQGADLICALREGQIVEQGTHKELMAKEGVYFNLVMSQTFVNEEGYSTTDSVVSQNKQRQNQKKSRKYSNRRRVSTVYEDTSRLTADVEEEGVYIPSITKIISYCSNDWVLLMVSVIASAAVGASTPVFGLFYGQIFQTFSLSEEDMRSASFFWTMMFVVLAVVTFIAWVTSMVSTGYVGENLVKSLREKAFTNILRQNIGWFDDEKHSSGKLCTRLATDVPMIKAAAGHRVMMMTCGFFTLFTGFLISYIIGWQLSLALTIIVPVLFIMGGIQYKVQKGNQQRDAMLMEEAGKIAAEAIENIRTVQALTREQIFFQNYVTNLLEPFMENKKNALVYGVVYGFSQATIFFIYAGAFRFGAYLVGAGAMIALNVYRVFFVMSYSAVSVGQMVSYFPDYFKAKLSAGLILRLTERQPEIDSFSSVGIRPNLTGEISFHEVVFRYPNRPSAIILNDINLTVRRGQTLALVGSSGCGKSTVVALLLRFYDPNEGVIRMDGFDIRTLNVTHLRQRIATVSQEPVLFNCSIRENIIYGIKHSVTQDQVEKVARDANIHYFIESLPHGYETMVGERGTQLSGGQKQRIAIARALVRNPVILLLDEATSALDTESEKVVQEALDKAREGRTCIVIAHRLSTVINADAIAVIDEGQIVETGTHEQLMYKKGAYYRLTKKQRIAQ